MNADSPTKDVEGLASRSSAKGSEDPTKDGVAENGASVIIRYIWALAHLAMSTVFAYSAVVQVNDPDWHLWFAIYVFSSVVCAGLVFQSAGLPASVGKMPWPSMAQFAALISGFTLIVLTASQGRVDFSIYTEEGREACGLALVSTWMAVSWRVSPGGVGRRDSSEVGAAAIATMLLGLASVVLVSIWVVPRYLLDPEHVGDHCRGIGFGPEL